MRFWKPIYFTMGLAAVTMAAAIATIAAVAPAGASEAINLKTRPGVFQSFMFIKPDKPVASVILFAGGHGALDVSSGSVGWGENNFLVRTREDFVKHGFMVALVDSPSDRPQGMYGIFRVTWEHAEDIDAVIAWLRKQADVPVWLVGTSRGTESAASVAIRTQQGIDGLVLTASTTYGGRDGTAVSNMPLMEIKVPTLLIHHAEDNCRGNQPESLHGIIDMFDDPKPKVLLFKGGYDRGRPCGPESYHGFLGIEDKVIEAIASFIKGN